MRKAFIIGCVLGLAAHASERRLSTVQGTLIQTWYAPSATATASATSTNFGLKVSIQCPNVDGGSGQKVYYRPGCLAKLPDAGRMCSHDAGVGDVIMDFTAATGAQDPYRIDLAGNEDRIHLASVNGYSDAVYCHVYRVSP